MSPYRGISVSILQVSYLVLLSTVTAFKLSILSSSTFPGDSLAISWFASDGDPQDFDLEVGFCGGETTPSLFDQPAIDAQASNLRHASIPKTLPVGLEPPVQCFVKAFDSDTGVVLDSVSIELVASDTAPLTSSTPETTTTPHSTSRIPQPTTHSSTTSSSVKKSTPRPVSTPSSSTKSSSSSSTITSSSSSSPLLTSSSTTSSSSSNSSSSTLDSETSNPTTTNGVASTIPVRTSGSTSGSTTTTATSIAEPSHSSVSSDNAKRPIGPLVGEALAAAFAFLLLLSFLITLYVWRRRRRLRERIAKPFRPDTGYFQPTTKQEEIENGRSADASGSGSGGNTSVQSNLEPVVLIATEKGDLARGDSVRSLESETGAGTMAGVGAGARAVVATVEEEVTMLRERLMALEDRHRELTGELRSAEFIPPVYSR